jgi:hypothetical protein
LSFGGRITVSNIARGLLEQLQAYWDRQRAGRDLPARADIDPVDIPRLLPHLVMIDVHYDAEGRLADFGYRLWGQHVIDHNNRSLVGRRLSDLVRDDPRQKRWLDHYTRAAAERRPMFDTATYRTVTDTVKTMDFAVFPLAPAGGRVEALLGGVVYREHPVSLDPDEPS